MSWKDEISKDSSQSPRWDKEAGDTMESMLNYAALEILQLVSHSSKENPALKTSIIEVIKDARRRINKISKE